jgi:hypothetical protein
MRYPRSILLIVFTFALASFCIAQASQSETTKASTTAKPVIDNDFVHKQFGADFTFEPKYSPMRADFDGDGVEDLALVARAKNPMADEVEHKYRVLDPYYGFYGTGDPRITMSFGADSPEQKGLVICIIHGAGYNAWQADEPKAKFVVINLPFKDLAVKHIQIKKKVVNAIYAEVTSTIQDSSVIFFDGKKYKYQPMGTELQ